MNNKLERAKKNLRGRKGFSLVELIIVIAIMAALVAILAPQYIKYVDSSRKTADKNTAEEIYTACKVAATDSTVTGAFTATWDGTNLTFTGTEKDDAGVAVAANLGTAAPASDKIAIAAKYTGSITSSYAVAYSGTTFTTSGGWW